MSTQNIEFRKGFLLAIAENGFTPDDLGGWCQKQSDWGPFEIEWDPTEAVAGLGRAAGTAFVDAPIAATLATGALGIGGGWLASKLMAPKYDARKEDPVSNQYLEDLKNQQLVRELRLQSERIRRRMAHKRSQQRAALK